MAAYRFCKDRQKQWALTSGLNLIGSAGNRGEPAYTTSLEANLFEPLSNDSRGEFEQGDGDELVDRGVPLKMQAVHSSSALACNLFHYWRQRSGMQPIAQALQFPTEEIRSIEFEAKRPIMDNPNRRIFRKDPNLDVAIIIAAPSAVQEVGVECKFTEPYRPSEPEKKGLAPAYLREEHLWTELPNVLELAQQLCPRDDQFVHLHAAQLIKHILGLKHRNGKSAFKLLYLWFDVPGSAEAKRHREEINEFSEFVENDGILFFATTVQDFIGKLAMHRVGHERYIDYLVSRYR